MQSWRVVLGLGEKMPVSLAFWAEPSFPFPAKCTGLGLSGCLVHRILKPGTLEPSRIYVLKSCFYDNGTAPSLHVAEETLQVGTRPTPPPWPPGSLCISGIPLG